VSRRPCRRVFPQPRLLESMTTVTGLRWYSRTLRGVTLCTPCELSAHRGAGRVGTLAEHDVAPALKDLARDRLRPCRGSAGLAADRYAIPPKRLILGRRLTCNAVVPLAERAPAI